MYSEKLLPRIGGRNTLGASLMTLLLVLVMLLPMIFLVSSLVNGADTLIDEVRPYVEQGLPSRAAQISRRSAALRQRHRCQLPPHRQQPGGTQHAAQATDRPRPPPGAGHRQGRRQRPAATGAGAVRHLLPLPRRRGHRQRALRRRPQAGRRPRRGNARTDARHGGRRHARHRRHGGRAGHGGDGRLPDRRRAGSGAARLRHLLPVDDPDRPAADLGRRRRLALQSGRNRLGDLSGALWPASSSAASTIS